MKQFLIIILYCFYITSNAQSDFLKKWEQEALKKGNSWSYYTNTATSSYYQTFTSLYVNGNYVASFSDAGTCRSKITELKQLAGQIYNTNVASQQNKQSSSGMNPKGDAWNDLARMTGVNKQEVNRSMNNINNTVNKQLNANSAGSQQGELAEIDRYCLCRTEYNPNYDPNAMSSMIDNNDNLVGNDNQDNLFGTANTQYENILEAPNARNRTFGTNQTNQPSISINFDEVMNNSTTAYIGNSQTQINQNPDDLTINMKIQAQPQLESLNALSAIDKEYERRELIAKQNKAKLFEVDSLYSQKETLQIKYDDILKTCNKFSEFDCLNQLKPIADELRIIEEKINWQERINNMSEEALDAQKNNYQTFEDMAILAWSSYPEKQNESSSAFEKSNYTKIESWKENLSGFDCTLYKKEDGTYVLAFAGTDEIKDMTGSWIQGAIAPQTSITSTPTQIEEALKVIKELENNGYPMDKLTLTGHSLGGRLAAEAALKNDLTAYTFNSAGVSIETKEWIEKEGKQGNAGKIINIQAGDDILTNIQETTSTVVGGKTPYVNNDYVKSKTKNKPIVGKIVGQNITTVGGQIKIGESTGGHGINNLYESIVVRKESILYEIDKRKSN